METKRKFGMRDLVGYALGDFGCNMSFAFIHNYLMLFYVTCMGIKPAHFAAVIVAGKVFDAINDPIIGNLCDRTKPGKNGKFKPWIKWASIPLLICSVLMFIYVPNAAYGVKVAMCLVLYCIWSIAYTSVNVPYGALQSVISDVPSERSSLSTWRSIGAMLAQLPVLVILPMIVYDEEKNPKGEIFIYIVAIMGVIGFVAFYLLRKLTTERVEPIVTAEKTSLIKSIGGFLRNRNILAVTISSVANIALIMTLTNSMQYLFMCYFQDTSKLSIGTVIAGLPVLFGILLVKPALNLFSKKQLCSWPFLITTAATAVTTFVKFTNPWIWMMFIGIAMFGSCFYLVLTWALVSDSIDYQAKMTGRREEGSVYALYSFFRKVAQGLGSAFVALALGFTGYDETLAATAQAPGVADKFYVATSFLPLIGSIFAFLSMKFMYNLDEKDSEVSHEN